MDFQLTLTSDSLGLLSKQLTLLDVVHYFCSPSLTWPGRYWQLGLVSTSPSITEHIYRLSHCLYTCSRPSTLQARAQSLSLTPRKHFLSSIEVGDLISLRCHQALTINRSRNEFVGCYKFVLGRSLDCLFSQHDGRIWTNWCFRLLCVSSPKSMTSTGILF